MVHRCAWLMRALYWAQVEDRMRAMLTVLRQREASVSALVIQKLTRDVREHWPGTSDAAGADKWTRTTHPMLQPPPYCLQGTHRIHLILQQHRENMCQQMLSKSLY